MKTANSETLEQLHAHTTHVIAITSTQLHGGLENNPAQQTSTQHHQLAANEYMAAHCNAFQPQSNSSSKSSVRGTPEMLPYCSAHQLLTFVLQCHARLSVYVG
jgi:hypothetical protein